MQFDVNDLTVGQIKEIQALLPKAKAKADKRVPYEVGKNYFIRTVTHYYTGKLKEIFSEELVLEQAAWIADTGRFHTFLKTGSVSEVEPFVDAVIIPRGAVVDITEWKHALPKDQK